MIGVVAMNMTLLVERVNGESGRAIWRAALAGNEMCRRHGPTRESAIDAVVRAYVMPIAAAELAAMQQAVKQADPKGGPSP